MKNFIYFESTEGGMDTIEGINSDGGELCTLSGWMDKNCESEDKLLVEWMKTALVGQKCYHRLGCLVRLIDV